MNLKHNLLKLLITPIKLVNCYLYFYSVNKINI